MRAMVLKAPKTPLQETEVATPTPGRGNRGRTVRG